MYNQRLRGCIPPASGTSRSQGPVHGDRVGSRETVEVEGASHVVKVSHPDKVAASAARKGDDGVVPFPHLRERLVSSARTSLASLAKLVGLTAAALLLLTGCASGADVTPTGKTTEVTVTVDGMRFVPDSIDVPVGDRLVIDFKNTGMVVHDLVLASGAGTEQLAPGKSQKIDAGVIGEDVDGWCSVSNHRAMGMVMKVNAVEK